VLGQTTRLPLMLSPTALQRLFHWQGERAVAAAAEKFGLWFGISSLASVGIEEIGAKFTGPKMLQYYYHKDKRLNSALLEATPVPGPLTGNDTPSGDGGNVWSKTSNPSNGTATVNANGTFTYTPNANFFGTDSFTYRVCDADGDCSTATVTITITPVNEVPLAVNDTYTVNIGQIVNGTAQANDTPSPDGGNVWSTLTTPPWSSFGTLPGTRA